MRRDSKRQVLVIFTLLIFFSLMSVGYAAFATSLSIKGTTAISGKWDVKITGISVSGVVGNGENSGTPSFSATTAIMTANLYEKGDAVEYLVLVKNNGNIRAKLGSITTSASDNSAIKFTTTGVTKDSILEAGETAQVKIKVEYDNNFNGTLANNMGTSTVTLNYVQA